MQSTAFNELEPDLADGVEDAPMTRRELDVHLYNQWSQDPSKKNLSVLAKHLSPIMYREVNRAGTSLPRSVLEAEAKIWTAKAIKSYDPSKGTALSTHLVNYVQRVRRMNYMYQNAARLPENQQRKFGAYEMTRKKLEDELNREPTDEEVAKAMGWSKGAVVKFKGMLYADLSESGSSSPSEFTSFSDEGLLMKELLSHLTQEELTIFENKGKMTSGQLAAKLGVDTNALNYKQRKLVDKIGYLKRELGL